MTDKELLRLAAKAMGFSVWTDIDVRLYSRTAGTEVKWNPLTNDGDALRLAVKLHLLYGINTDLMNHYYWLEWKENGGADPYAATRRAIVRAAAELGRAMP